MLSSAILAVLKTSSGRFFVLLRRFGGLGFIPLGLVDSSVIPIPGSMDAFTILLASGQHNWWPYYAFMATVGSMIGGYTTYRIARKEGKETLGRRLSHSKMQAVEDIFAKWGFGAIVVSALCPPPMPIVPFLIAAGAAQYPAKRFLAALGFGRAIRYTALAFLAATYGSTIWTLISQHGMTFLWIGIGLMGVSAGVAIYIYFRDRGPRKPERKGAAKTEKDPKPSGIPSKV